MREFRRRRPDFRERERAANRANTRALWKLAALHVEEYERLCDGERLTEGLPPLHTVPTGRPPGCPPAQYDGSGASDG